MSNLILPGYMAKQGWPALVGEDREADVARLEERYDVILPDDFRNYLLTLCPVEDQLDDDLGTWWGLNSITNISEGYEHQVILAGVNGRAPQYLLFMDFSFWSWAWAIACTDDHNRGKVALVGGLPDRFVAASFTEFAERYVVDWASVC